MKANVVAKATGVLRHDRWKDKKGGQWTGKVFVATDPGAGTLRSKGMASAPQRGDAKAA